MEKGRENHLIQTTWFSRYTASKQGQFMAARTTRYKGVAGMDTPAVKRDTQICPKCIASSDFDPHLGFPYFTAIDSLFNEGAALPKPKNGGFFGTSTRRIVDFQRRRRWRAAS
uniref:Uncharacterized protein n=1 Tax=Salix viminalis TaxID=40686 RepID=A0A6N2KIV9_SALVM